MKLKGNKDDEGFTWQFCRQMFARYIAPQLGAQRLAEEVCHRLWEELRKADVREPKDRERWGYLQ